jgi:chemotaxis protein methyltransferase CheR
MIAPEEVNGASTMRPSEFERIRKMVYAHCGVDLTGKQVLVSTRLGKKLRDMGFASFETYCQEVQRDPSGELFTSMIDTLTTNHTSFFREAQHFDFMRKEILPSFGDARHLSMWSAACSSGEEPYSIAFLLSEILGSSFSTRAKILATDISTRILDQARQGLYPISRLSGVSTEMRRNCLLKGTGKYEEYCLVKREIRAAIEFKHFNLLDDCSVLGNFHVIFCRNVMIYFDQQTQEALVNRLAARLVPGGYLLIGHSESLNGLQHPLQYLRPATFRKAGSGSGAHSSQRSFQ